MGDNVLHTPLCDMLGIRYPILQAGMGGNAIRGLVSNPELAAAVSEAGGLGVLGGAPISVEEFSHLVRVLKSLTNKPFGVNLVFPGGDAIVGGSPEVLSAKIPQDYKDFAHGILGEMKVEEAEKKLEPPHLYLTREVSMKKLEIVLEEKVPVLVYSLGDPGAETIDAAHQAGITVMALAGNVRQAVRLKAEGVDALVAVGYEAGGHSGYIGSMALVPQVVDAVKPLPVLAGGGISDGRGLVAALALGAEGAWVGTRFMTSEESATVPWMKKLALEAGDTSTVKSKFISGKPNRHLRSPWDDAWEETAKKPLPIPLQGLLFWDYFTSITQAEAFEVSGETMGQGVGLIDSIKPAKQIVEDMVAKAIQVYGEMGGRFI
ncbi:MAG: nitronate monooxygenase family protein [Dehalococcoidia bacterium]|nr:nitronate monooxygenase family protein [Dehalococcoidia bacterium]